jgi:Nickel responsive protein SCO4226-like
LPSYVVEAYVPRLSREELRSFEQRLRDAAEIVSRNGTPIAHLRSVHVPNDETCFHFFEATSAETVGAAGREAGLVFDRITEALA